MSAIKNGCAWLLWVVAAGLCWQASAQGEAERACVLPTDWIGDPAAVTGHTFKIQFDYRFDTLGFLQTLRAVKPLRMRQRFGAASSPTIGPRRQRGRPSASTTTPLKPTRRSRSPRMWTI